MPEKNMLDYGKVGTTVGKIMTILQDAQMTNAETVGILKGCLALAESAVQMEGLAVMMARNMK